MRLDKLTSQSLCITRSQAKKLIGKSQILVNGQITKQANVVLSELDSVSYQGRLLCPSEKRYILLNKPEGYICSTRDEQYPSALRLLSSENIVGTPNLKQLNLEKLHFAGRLDVDTTGLVLISDDGKWSHRVTSPNAKKNKTYRIELAEPLSVPAINQLISGVKLKDSDKLTLPAEVMIIDQLTIRLTITEGRYHQVKRMLAAVGNRVVSLHRESIGQISLDDSLHEGKWRLLTSSEIELF